MQVKRVAVIGLGLIGSSLARALRERAGVDDIIAVDINRDWLDCAEKDGVIRQGYTEINEEIFGCSLIFICTPVRKALEYLNTLFSKVSADCIITDVCSTKAVIVGNVNNLQGGPCFIGGHPMTGSEKTGYHAGSAHIFENAYYVLTPSRHTTDVGMKLMEDIIGKIGGIPVVIDAEEHDRITAGISHVPHIVASALVNAVKGNDSPDGKMQLLAAGGFKDVTRIASSSPEMWENISISNKKQISGILNDFADSLKLFMKLLEEDNSEGLLEFFRQAKAYRDSLPLAGKGLITPYFDLIVDVLDKPGIIGQIAALLGDKGINIKNINVSNSREFEQGCLRISLPDPDSQTAAYDILAAAGYRVYKG